MVERSRAWRDMDADLFRFTTTDLRDLHVALMTAFEDAAVLAPALNLEQVRTALFTSGWDEPVADEALQRALDALVGWRLLEATQDHGAHYATPEEFERKNLQWSLTARGEAAIGGLLHALDSLRHAVGLQTAVLDAIGDGLADLADLLATSGATADARVHICLAEVEGHMAALVASVRQFNGYLQKLVREDATDDDVFVDVKRRTVSYLEEYVEGVERPQRRVAAAIDRLANAGTSTLFDRALAGANLAPVAGDDRRPPGWPSGPAGGPPCAPGSPPTTAPHPASPACSTSPAPRSSSCSASSSGAGTAAAGRRRWRRTTGAWPPSSPPRRGRPRPTACSPPPSASGPHATPT